MLREVKALADALGERRDPDVAARRRLEGRARASAPSPTRCAPSRPRATHALEAALARRPRTDLRGRLDALVAAVRRVKARKVKGLDPAGALADNAERIVAVRLDELCAFAPRVLDPAEVEALHDMRIAAKRLRYVLEVTGELLRPLRRTAGQAHEGAPGPPGRDPRLRRARPARARALVDELRDADVAAVLAGGEPAHGEDFRGLELLVVRTRARREAALRPVPRVWTDLEREGFRARLEYAIAERPAPDHEPVPA